MNGHGTAGALWSAIRRLTTCLMLLSGVIGAAPTAQAITYDYTGQPFDPNASNCLSGIITCVGGGKVTGSVTFNIPAGFTGSLFGGADITAFSLSASGTGVTNTYPDNSGINFPFSVLDAFSFKNGTITSASMYTRGNGVPGYNYPFNGGVIDIGTGYGGDVSITNQSNPNSVVYGYSDKPGTWSGSVPPPPPPTPPPTVTQLAELSNDAYAKSPAGTNGYNFLTRLN